MNEITVTELENILSDLICDGYEDYTVKLSVNYDHCDHIQKLTDTWCPTHDDIVDWILLQGGREK